MVLTPIRILTTTQPVERLNVLALCLGMASLMAFVGMYGTNLYSHHGFVMLDDAWRRLFNAAGKRAAVREYSSVGLDSREQLKLLVVF